MTKKYYPIISALLVFSLGLVLPLQSLALTLTNEQQQTIAEITQKTSFYISLLKNNPGSATASLNTMKSFTDESITFLKSIQNQNTVDSVKQNSPTAKTTTVVGYHNKVFQIESDQCKTADMTLIAAKNYLVLHFENGQAKFLDTLTGKTIEPQFVDLSANQNEDWSGIKVCDQEQQLYSLDNCQTQLKAEAFRDAINVKYSDYNQTTKEMFGDLPTTKATVCVTNGGEKIVKIGKETKYFTESEFTNLSINEIFTKYRTWVSVKPQTVDPDKKYVIEIGNKINQDGIGGDGVVVGVAVGAIILAAAIALIVSQTAAAVATEVAFHSFGGWVLEAIPCTCMPGVFSLWVLGYLGAIPMMMVFDLDLYTVIEYPEYMWMVPGTPVLGRATTIPSGFCWIGVEPFCAPIPGVNGKVILIGTGL